MQGLALARRYYEAHRDALLAPFSAIRPRIAAGLVGFGSECFGFDDAYSTDHDFGPGFCLWLSASDYATFGQDLQAAYARLPQHFEGFPPRQTNARSGQRVGVFAIADFYAQFLGAPAPPISPADWLQIPEPLLAAAVNGTVFADPTGEFSQWRQTLAAYYPESALRRKLATAVARMAQSGQYNLGRALQRQDAVAALLMQAEFVREACTAIHVLNRRYAPISKWLHRSIRDLPVLGSLHTAIGQLATCPAAQAEPWVEAICAELLGALIAQGFTTPGDRFLESHVDAILNHTEV